MPNNNTKIVIVPTLAAVLIGGLVFYLLGYQEGLSIKITAILGLSLILMIIPLYRSLKNAQDRKADRPLEDEMSRMLEIHAGAYAFRYSMISWFAIFIFRDKIPDPEELLGIGILAAGAIFGLCWLYFKQKGLPLSSQD